MSAPEPPRAVVFDFNGTISDDEPLLAELCAVIFAEIGIEVSRELYFGEYAGYSDPEIVERVLDRHGRSAPALAEQLLARRTALYLERAASGETVHAAAAACVREIAARVPVAVASGAAGAEVEAVLVGSGLRGLFDVIVAAEDVDAGSRTRWPTRRRSGGSASSPPGRSRSRTPTSGSRPRSRRGCDA